MTATLNTLPPGGFEIAPDARLSEAEPHAQSHARDIAAALSLLLITILYHVQDATLSQNSQIGLAFRNAALRRVLVILLAISALGLAALNRRETRDYGRRENVWLRALTLAAQIILGLFVIDVALVVFAGINPLIASAQGVLLEYAALIAVIVIAAPWQRVRLYRTTFVRFAPALLIAAAVLILWEVLINAFNIKQFLLPRPSVILTTFLNVYPKLVSAGWYTFQNALWGYLIGCGLGIGVGLLSARFTSFSRAALPFAIAANSVPIIAFAPIMNFWFGILNPLSKVSIVAVITFFPTMINTVRGLTSADENSLELMRSYAAREFVVFRKVRFPAALPYLFSALKVCTTLSMIGAVIGEFFGGAITGIGFRIRNDPANFDFADAWACILVVSALGILFYIVISLIERLVMPWHASLRDRSA